MAGHSKWANIKRRKAVVDAKRGKVFTRLAREIISAARQGGGNEPALLIVSPNPARESVNVRFFAGGSESGQLRLFDLTGRQVMGAQTLNRGENVQFPVNKLPSGMYLLEWTDGQNRTVRKLVLQ